SISLDGAGNSYIAGSTKSRNFPTAAPLQATLSGGGFFRSNDGANQWQASNNRLGGLTVLWFFLAPLSPPVLYAGTESGAIYRSTDGGTSWNASGSVLTDGGIRVIAVDPSNPQTLYAGTDGGVFKSTDGGTTWSSRNSGLGNLLVYGLVI